MDENYDMRKGDFQCLITIQKEMLEENRRLRLLTVWLLTTTFVMLAASLLPLILKI